MRQTTLYKHGETQVKHEQSHMGKLGHGSTWGENTQNVQIRDTNKCVCLDVKIKHTANRSNVFYANTAHGIEQKCNLKEFF